MELSKPIDPIAPITYDTTTTPWYFGAYLNMARHNVFLLINHVTDRFSHLQFKALANDEDIVHNPEHMHPGFPVICTQF